MIHKVFETFNQFVEIKKVLRPHLPQIIEKALIISAKDDYAVNVREVTMLFLELIAENYARVLIKNHGTKFIEAIVEAGFNIASEDPGRYDPNDETPPSMAINMLSIYACNVPNERIYPIFKTYLQRFGVSEDEH